MVNLDVAYVPTPKDIVRRMLRLARVHRGETVFDLGAGDGRILIEAVRGFGAKAIGVEVDPERLVRIKERLTATGTEATVIQGDLLEVDTSSADVVAIYLSSSVNAKLASKLRSELKAGARVVSLDYVLPGWVPERELTVQSGGVKRKIYSYVVKGESSNPKNLASRSTRLKRVSAGT
jgi:SAM-dependent methyltransferase